MPRDPSSSRKGKRSAKGRREGRDGGGLVATTSMTVTAIPPGLLKRAGQEDEEKEKEPEYGILTLPEDSDDADEGADGNSDSDDDGAPAGNEIEEDGSESEGGDESLQKRAKTAGHAAKSNDDDAAREEEDDEDDEEENDLQMEVEGGSETISCDIVAVEPEESDFGGIKLLVNQLLRDHSINHGDIADFCIVHAPCATVIKSAEDEEGEAEDDDEDGDGFGTGGAPQADGVFAVSAVIPLSGAQPVQKQLAEWLRKKGKSNANLQTALGPKSLKSTAFVLNERMMNLPPQLGTALLDNLNNEISAMEAAHRPSTIVMLFKGYQYTRAKKGGKKSMPTKQKKAAQKGSGPMMHDGLEIEYYGPEDAILIQNASFTHHYEVAKTAGQLQDSTQPDKMLRTVAVLSAKGLRTAAKQIGRAFNAVYS